jgi:sporulation protein YabP
MDKLTTVEVLNHNISITDRKNIVLSGIKKISSFDECEFFVESVMGPIIIKGEGLELLKLDTFQGNLSIKGKINSINYLDSSNKRIKTESVLSRLFK